MRGSNFSLKELSLANGLGSAIPEDAAAVLVLGPKTQSYPEEIETFSTAIEIRRQLDDCP